MSFRFKTPDLDREMREVAEAVLGQATQALDQVDPAGGTSVHRARKSCKKVRGLLGLLRPGLDKASRKESRFIGAAAARLGPSRDATVRLRTLDGLLTRYSQHISPAGFLPLKQFLEARESAAIRQLPESIDGFRNEIDAARARVDRWVLLKPNARTLRKSLHKSFADGRSAMTSASASDAHSEAFHTWRKRSKALWYGCRLLNPVWPERLSVEEADLHRLDELLGELNDIAVLLDLVTRKGEQALPSALGRQVLGLIGQDRCRDLRSEAFKLGRRIYAEQPDAYADRIAAYWQIWAAEHAL